ncbi:MAG: pyridoxal-phosphate dependent enzyme [Proteobacteria bacterium]|nr:pyridoxal-phosphate dependent enzyme [Pseudomonadota bacterium]
MQHGLNIAAPAIEGVHCDFLTQHDVDLNVLRLDLVHPSVHGNKWFKLKGNIEQIRKLGCNRVVSFGGAYSNHIYALAALGKLLGFKTTGFIRGEIVRPLNPVLAFADNAGMQLVAISRGDYRRKHEPEFLRQLLADFGDCYLLPEGGSNLLAVKGCEEIVDFLRWPSSVDVTNAEVEDGKGNREEGEGDEDERGEDERQAGGSRILALSCGTGATIAGIISGLKRQGYGSRVSVIGVSVLKAEAYIEKQVDYWLAQLDAQQPLENGQRSVVHWRVAEDYHCGGYRKSSPELTAFMAEFAGYCQIPIEPVYTGKLFLAIFDMIRRGVIARGSEVLAIHTGGVMFNQPTA